MVYPIGREKKIYKQFPALFDSLALASPLPIYPGVLGFLVQNGN